MEIQNIQTGSVAELLRYRHLLNCMTWRDLRVRYKQSLIGVAWAILLPLMMTAIFAFVFTRAVHLAAADASLPYPLYALAGLAPWTFFSGSLSNCVNVLVANRNLITKVYFPHEVFLLSCVFSALVDFVIALVVLAGLMAYYHTTGQWRFQLTPAIVCLPILLLIQIILTFGLGLLLSMANLFYRDVRHVFSVGIQLLMFVSAVVVPVPSDASLFARAVQLNPLASLFDAYRVCLLHGRWPEFSQLIGTAGISLGMLVIGWVMFKRLSHRFAELV